MNRFRFAFFLALSFSSFTGCLLLSGCSGFGGGTFPETNSQVAAGAIHGNVYGGHAPITGAHVFLLEAETTTGYGGKATSLLSSTYAGTAFPTARDLMGSAATNPTYGLYYVTSDATGSYNVSSDYTCTPGRPVYLYAQGGTASYPSGSNTFSINNASVADNGSTGGTFTYTTTTTENFYVGEQVAVTGYTAPGMGFNQSGMVLASGLTTNNFSIFVPYNATYVGGSFSGFTAPGTVTGSPNLNPQIVNLAMLGNCPGTAGEFANTISFVYMNEISTIATAYAMSGFAATSTGVIDATHIGTSSSNLIGLQNAAVNVKQLYDIQGSNLSNTYAGEGHIARAVTPAGNGVVPQATLDTLGNILAACVDSQNTYNPYVSPATGTKSPQCTTLFNTATTTGGATGGTVPLDIATAALNIAHLPAGAAASTSTFMSNLYTLPTGNIPFGPQLTAQPNDFTVAIQYSTGLNPALDHAESIGIDGLGNIWMNSAFRKTIFKMNPLGVVTFESAAASYPYGYLSVDPSNNIWTGNNNQTTNETEFNNGGTVISGGGYPGPYTGGTFFDGYITVTDSTGSAYVGATPPTNNSQWAMLKFTSSGGNATGSPFDISSSIPANYHVAHGAVENVNTGGDVWFTTEGLFSIGRYDPTTGALASGFPITTSTPGITAINAPEMPGFDSASNMWVANQNNGSGGSVTKVTTAGAVSNPTGGLLAGPFGVTIDGLGNVFVANRGTGNGSGASTIVEYNGATSVAISPATNYTLGGQLNHPLNLAIDASGVLWMTSYDNSQVVEMIGQAAPATVPLSYASGVNKLGVRP